MGSYGIELVPSDTTNEDCCMCVLMVLEDANLGRALGGGEGVSGGNYLVAPWLALFHLTPLLFEGNEWGG